MLRRIVELIARLDMQAKLSQDDLVDIIVAMVPALIEPDSSSTNESVAVTFVYHLVREFQRECAMAQYLLQVRRGVVDSACCRQGGALCVWAVN